MSHPTQLDRTARLADGRTLAYADLGDPRGPAVLYFHGSPGSRLEGQLLAPAATSHGLRLIAVDRPGFGRSDPKRDRALLDWPGDIEQLADALSLERFAVVGASGGGPYAAACAYRLHARLFAAAIVCGVAPFAQTAATARSEPGPEAILPPGVRRLLAVIRRAPWLPAVAVLPVILAMRHRPDRALRHMKRFMPEPDRLALDRPEVAAIFRESLPEALRQGPRSAHTELMIYARPWGFDLADIPIEVHVFQGELDRSVPVQMARSIAARIPRSRAVYFADEGHFSIGINRAGEILGALRPA